MKRMTADEYRSMSYGTTSKYRNVKTVVDGITFDSKKEAARYGELILFARSGEIQDLELQKTFLLIDKQPGERAVTYKADFAYKQDGREIVEDVKSEITRKDKAYIIKRKLFKWRYPDIEFREV